MRPEREAELRRVYREHVDAVYAFFAYTLARAHAEDLTSSTFERVVRHWDRYDAAKASERTWILAIARNLLTDHFRRSRLRDGISIDEHPALIDSLASDDEHGRRLERDEVRSWLEGLQPRERDLLALRYGADLTAKDIAALTDLTEANVHQILSRALRKLRDRAQRTTS